MAETYLLAIRCPVYRRRDSHSGFRTELENLADDAKDLSPNNCFDQTAFERDSRQLRSFDRVAYLGSDPKGKGASGRNREAESTDAPARGGLLRSSDEAG